MTNEERLTQEELEAIRERTEKATKGPWIQNTRGNYEDYVVWGPKGVGYRAICNVDVNYKSDPNVRDAVFIANARTDIPKLLTEIDRIKTDYLDLKYFIEDTETNCVECGDYFMPKVGSDATLYYCGECREDVSL